MRPHLVPILILGLVAMIVGGSYLIQHSLENNSKKMTTQLNKVQQALNNGDQKDAGKALSVFEKTWKTTKKGWSIITDHREMDEIEMSLARLESLLKRKSPTLALEELSVMQHLVKHIPEKERFNWMNVL